MKESKHHRNTGLQIVSTRWRVCFLDCGKKPVKEMSIRAIYPSIGLELPQQTSQLRMTGDCVQPVSSGRVQRCVWLCLVTLNSPIAYHSAQNNTRRSSVPCLQTFTFHPHLCYVDTVRHDIDSLRGLPVEPCRDRIKQRPNEMQRLSESCWSVRRTSFALIANEMVSLSCQHVRDFPIMIFDLL